MIKFSKDKVLLLHKLITEETGGDPHLRDLDLLTVHWNRRFKPLAARNSTPPRKKKGRGWAMR